MTTSLVTGGAGFIGSHVVDHLLKMGHRVVILDDLSGGSRDNLPDPRGYSTKDRQWDFWNYSILDLDAIEQAFHLEELAGHPIDYVFHLAAYAAEGLSHYIRRYNYETNVIGSINLINAAVNYGVKRFVFTSSAAVYGDMSLAEGEHPIDPYGIAKLTVEQDLKAACSHFDLPYTIFRCHNVYGERQNLNDGYRNVVGIFMRQFLMGQPFTIFGDGKQTRQFTYIHDIAPNIAQSVDMPNTERKTYNIGTSSDCSINILAHMIGEIGSGDKLYRHPVVHLPPRNEVRDVYVDHIQYSVDFEDNYTGLLKGLKSMFAWAKTQTLRDPKPFAEIEIEKGLPDHWRKLSVK